MRKAYLSGAILAGFVAAASAQQYGTITGLTVAPTTAQQGAAVSATATGSNPCGAVHINWGDGDAITYATETLPVTQTHVYKTAGAFTVRAQGMGNCKGDATARVTITAPPPPPAPPPAAPPPPPPPPAPKLTALNVDNPPGAAPSLRVITVAGSGRCSYVLDFGDGNSETREATLPDGVRHNYPAAGRYTVIATARPPCTGVLRSTFIASAQPAPPREIAPAISGVQVRPLAARIAQRISVTVAGTGTCQFAVNFGDGETRSYTERLPAVVNYQYARAGEYSILVTGTAPCTGGGDGLVRVRRR